MTAPVAPMEARWCDACHDTGSLSKQLDGWLDCHYCDAIDKRLAMRNHIAQFTGWPKSDATAWAAYLFAKRQAAPVAQLAQQVEAVEQVNQWRTFGETPWFDGEPPHSSPAYEVRTLYAAPQLEAQQAGDVAPIDDASKDAERLLFVTEGLDGFTHVAWDKYEYATHFAQCNGRDEPNEDDFLIGLRAMIDAAIAQGKKA